MSVCNELKIMICVHRVRFVKDYILITMLLHPNNIAFTKALHNPSSNGLRSAFGVNWTAGSVLLTFIYNFSAIIL